MSNRRSRVVALIAVLGALACHAARPPGEPGPAANRSFVGTWRFVSATYMQADGSVQKVDSTQLQLLKVIGPTHFAYVTQAVAPQGARFVRAGAGTYTVASGKYTETIALTSVDNMRGQAYAFDYTLDGDTWHQTGMIGTTRIDELYRRVR